MPEIVEGDLNLSFLENAKGLKLPEKVRNLYLRSLESAEGLELPKEVGNLDLCSLKSAKDLELPEIVKGKLYLSSLESTEGLKLSDGIDMDKVYLPYNIDEELLTGKNSRKAR